MPEHRYAPPSAHVEDVAPVESAVLSVFVGAAVGNGAAYGVLSVVGVAYLWILVLGGVPAERVYSEIYGSVPFLLFNHLLGFACEAVGGYWCARLSRSRSVARAFACGLLGSALAGIQVTSPFAGIIPIWSRLLSVLIPTVGSVVGARYRVGLTPPSTWRL
jgi:hypothetical protein